MVDWRPDGVATAHDAPLLGGSRHRARGLTSRSFRRAPPRTDSRLPGAPHLVAGQANRPLIHSLWWPDAAWQAHP